MSIRAVLRTMLVMVLAALTLAVATPPPQANASVVVHAYTYDGHHPQCVVDLHRQELGLGDRRGSRGVG